MTADEFRNLKIGNKIRKPGTDRVYTVVNNDPPGNVILIPGRITKVAYRPVHPSGWEFDPDQKDES